MHDDSLPDRSRRHHSRPPAEPKRTHDLHAFGSAIRELRAGHSLSQEALGYRSGLHRNYVGAIERGEINPTFRVLLKLASGLAMPVSEIAQTYERHREALDLHNPLPRPKPRGPARTDSR